MNPLDILEIKPILESLIFVSETPVRIERLAEALDVDKESLKVPLHELVEEYRQRNGGFLLQEVAGGFQFRSRSEYAEWIRRLQKNKPFRFSRAALETLAIIAYRQPVTRAEVEYLRGVDSGGVVKTLLEKHLIRILGKKDIAGRPLLYGTTSDFLQLFGLADLSSLPTLKEFSELSADMLDADSAAVADVGASDSEEAKWPEDDMED